MKKFLSFLLAAMMLLSCLPAVAAAEGFPELDGIAAWDYIGDWFGVSGMDVMGDPTADYPELKLCLYLNGLGDLYLDGGKKEVVGWYIEEGNVFLARTVDGVPKADEIFAYANKDDTGRLVVDLMTVSVRCEQEGEEYTDVVWPEFNAEDAKYFVGTWKAVTYISGEEEIPAELAGPMTIVLNDDGTAQSVEGEEEPYELRWYSDSYVAYLGETPTELVEISFDGNGNISVKMDAETTVIMAPFAETGTILGTWETSDRTVEITEDGKLKLIYKEDGYTNHMKWEIVNDIPTVTLGTWKDSTIEFVDGYLIINYSVQQKLTRVGAVPEIYVGPGGFAVPAGDSSAAFLGDWEEESGRGVLTFNEDFTAVMNFTDGRVYDMNWKTTEDGAMFTSGNWFDTAMVIENETTLNIGDGWMILYREGAEDSGDDELPTAQPIGPEGEPYFGTWTMDLGGRAMNLILNQDGTCAMEMMGEAEPGVWTVVDGKANVMGDELYIDDAGQLVMPSADMTFVKSEGGAAAPAVPAAPEGGKDVSQLPETLQPYAGTWHMVYFAAGSTEGAANDLGISGKLVLNTDGTGVLSGAADDSGAWYDDEGQVRFGAADTALTLLEGGFLRYGTMLGGYMIFSQDETAVWDPAPAETEAPAAPAVGTGSTTVGLDSLADYTGKKFVAKTYTVAGFSSDASLLNAEYAITIDANQTCELIMGGYPVLLKWTQGQGTLDGETKDALVIDYMGVATYYVYLTDAGIDLDMNGMVLNMVAE